MAAVIRQGRRERALPRANIRAARVTISDPTLGPLLAAVDARHADFLPSSRYTNDAEDDNDDEDAGPSPAIHRNA